MLRAVVLVQDEHWELHYFKVDHEVPEDDGVVIDEGLLRQHSVSLLGQCVDKLFVEGNWGQQVHRQTLSVFDEGRSQLALDDELGDEALFAVGTPHRVVRLVLREQTEQLLFANGGVAVGAFFLQLDEQRAFQDLAQFDHAVLRLDLGVWFLEKIIKIVISGTTLAECCVDTALLLAVGAKLVPLFDFFAVSQTFDLLHVRNVIALSVS